MVKDRARELVAQEAMKHMKIGRFALTTGAQLSAEAHLELALALLTVLMEAER